MDKKSMSQKLRTVLVTIVGVIIGLAASWPLLVLLSIIIFPLWLFLMSDLPQPWTNIQEITISAMGIISLVLIILCGILGGWLGWWLSQGRSLKDFIENLRLKIGKIWQNFKLPIVIVSTTVILVVLGLDAIIVFKSMRPPLSIPPTSTPSIQQVTITTDKAEYEQGEMVKITIKNNSSDERLYSPYYSAERFSDSNWIAIKRVFCPCDVRCKLTRYFILSPHEVKEYQWDQKETWCSDPTRISKTISNQVLPGKYRIKSVENNPNENGSPKTIYSNEFRIKEKATTQKDPRCLMPKPTEIGGCEILWGFYYDPSLNECKAIGGCKLEGGTPFNGSQGKECIQFCVEK